MMLKIATALASIALLVSCYSEPGDLRKELRELSADQQGKVHPLPALRPQPQSAYGSGRLPDPFYPDLRPDQRAAGIRELATALTFDDVMAVRPADIRSPFSGKSIGELVLVLNDNFRPARMATEGCTIEWTWDAKEAANLPAKRFTARVDSRDLEAGGLEIYNKRLMYHPRAKGEKFVVVSPGDTAEWKSDWHTLTIRDARPNRYWVVVGAFQELTDQIRRACPPRS